MKEAEKGLIAGTDSVKDRNAKDRENRAKRERICKNCGAIHFRHQQQVCSDQCKEERAKHRGKRQRENFKARHGKDYWRKHEAKRDIEKKRESWNKARRERTKSDPTWAIKDRVRVRTKEAFRRMGYGKSATTKEIIGCDWPTLKAHIERQFVRGMSWSNRERWHVDHIIPLASAKTSEEVVRLCHFSNLRPLWADENLSKGDRIVECQPELTLLML